MIQETTEHFEEPVTEVTETQSHINTQLETSPEVKLSPVTVKSQHPKSTSENVRWLLQFLADLEANPTPNSRFSSIEHLISLFHESEQRANSCYEELLSVCSDYFERFGSAFKIVSESLT